MGRCRRRRICLSEEDREMGRCMRTEEVGERDGDVVGMEGEEVDMAEDGVVGTDVRAPCVLC